LPLAMIEMMRSDETRARRPVSPIHPGLTEGTCWRRSWNIERYLNWSWRGWKAASPATTFPPTVTPEGDEPDNAGRCYASHRRAGRPAREVEAILQISTGLLAKRSRSGYFRNEEQNSRGRNRRAESYCNSTYCIALQSGMIRRCEVRYSSKRASPRFQKILPFSKTSTVESSNPTCPVRVLKMGCGQYGERTWTQIIGGQSGLA
jgi:hypothetical protein